MDTVVDGGAGTACVFAGGERIGIMVGGFGAPAGFWAQASARRWISRRPTVFARGLGTGSVTGGG